MLGLLYVCRKRNVCTTLTLHLQALHIQAQCKHRFRVTLFLFSYNYALLVEAAKDINNITQFQRKQRYGLSVLQTNDTYKMYLQALFSNFFLQSNRQKSSLDMGQG